MSISVTVPKENLKQIEKNLKKTGKLINDKIILSHILLKLKNRILLRTLAGKDVNKNNFDQYNQRYAIKEGKTLVNLQKTGLMLNSMTQKVLSNNVGVIFFSNATAKQRAIWHNTGAGRLPKREFFGINSFDETNAVETYEDELYKARKKEGLI